MRLFSVLLVLRVICFLDFGGGLLFSGCLGFGFRGGGLTLVCWFCVDCDVCVDFVG